MSFKKLKVGDKLEVIKPLFSFDFTNTEILYTEEELKESIVEFFSIGDIWECVESDYGNKLLTIIKKRRRYYVSKEWTKEGFKKKIFKFVKS